MVSTGRVSSQLTALLREAISSGQLVTGGYLPTVRDLSREHGLATRTVQRALGALEAEGLVVAEPRRGYRVLARANDPNRSLPLAYILSTDDPPARWDEMHMQLSACLQAAAAKHGWSLLAVSAGPEARVPIVMDKLRSARACGVVLDTLDTEMIAASARMGLPAVMVDAWLEDLTVDAVLQDNYRGGFLAAKHLLEQGHREICWFGNLTESSHARERFGGAAAALMTAGVSLTGMVAVNKQNMEAEAHALLGRANRPRAILALWRDIALCVAQAAQARGLVLGKDLDLVGWSIEELYEAGYRSRMPQNYAAPAVCWSAMTMAETALQRLVELRHRPGATSLRQHVPVRLRTS